MVTLPLVSCGVALLLAIVPVVQPLKLPTYLKGCSRSDPKFNECAKKSGQAGIPKFINGDKKYRVPNLNPLDILELQINQGSSQVGLKITLKNAKISGLKDTTINDVDFDLKNQNVMWRLTTPTVQLLSLYNITGKILLLPIFGNGDANITLKNVRFSYNFKFNTYKKNGEEYIRPQKGVIGYELDRAHIKLDNLFNGDKLLGPQMNKFLNENWMDAAREIGPSIVEALAQVIDGILKNICDTVPYKDIFLP